MISLRLAEYTSDYVDASELLDVLQTDPFVQRELFARSSAVASKDSLGTRRHSPVADREPGTNYAFSATYTTPCSNSHLGSGFPLAPIVPSGLR